MRVAIVSAVLLVACKGAGDASRQAKPDTAVAVSAPSNVAAASDVNTACDLLSAEDFARVTGVTLAHGVTTDDYMGVSQCRFDKQGDAAGGAIVALHQQGDLTRYRRVPGGAAVAGVGDSAVWNERTAQLAVQHGVSVFSISFFSPAAKKQWALGLARSALAKLASPKP